jgi:CheY-like chemotaxis protein
VAPPLLRILLVDDDAGHTALLRRNLLRSGVRSPTDTLESGAAALDYVFRRGPYAHRPEHRLLILLDINMPGGIDGIEVLRQLRAEPTTRDIPVVMLTTTDDPREIERCRELGCSRYVTKPIDPAVLVSILEDFG